MTRCRGCRGCRRRGVTTVSKRCRGVVGDPRRCHGCAAVDRRVPLAGPLVGRRTMLIGIRLCPRLSSCRYGANDSLLEYCDLFDHIQISWLSNYLTIFVLSHRHASQQTCSLRTRDQLCPVTVASKSIVSIALTTTIDGSSCAPIDILRPAHSHRLLTTIPRAEPLHNDRRALTRSHYQLPLFQNRLGPQFSQ